MNIKQNETQNKNTTMKKNLTTPKIISSVILAISGYALSAQANPIPISGDISLSGTVSMNGSSFVTATAFTGFQDVTVGGPSAVTGDYVGTSGSAVTVTPFTWSPPTASTPINPLWSFVHDGDTYSFDLTILHEDYASPTGLLLSGQGTAYITGPGTDYLPTSGTWDFSSQSQGQTSFTYSSTTMVPSVSVPDSGSTMSMMGASLIGLFVIGRKQKQSLGKVG
jgi:hypothetical protein